MEAVKLYRLAAVQGEAGAQLSLGVLYHNGQGVPKDYSRAYAWFNIAAAQGKKRAVKYRGNLSKKMDPSQIAEGQKICRELFKRMSNDK